MTVVLRAVGPRVDSQRCTMRTRAAVLLLSLASAGCGARTEIEHPAVPQRDSADFDAVADSTVSIEEGSRTSPREQCSDLLVHWIYRSDRRNDCQTGVPIIENQRLYLDRVPGTDRAVLSIWEMQYIGDDGGLWRNDAGLVRYPPLFVQLRWDGGRWQLEPNQHFLIGDYRRSTTSFPFFQVEFTSGSVWLEGGLIHMMVRGSADLTRGTMTNSCFSLSGAPCTTRWRP